MTANNQVHFYGAIEKFDAADDGSLLVSGIASTEAVDAQGEVVTADAMRKALPAYLQKGTVREMHRPLAAGVPVSAHVDDDGKTHFTARIVDAGTISKIKAGVLKGFSIGGKAMKKVGQTITELLLKDISVVDIPCNPESYFTVIKFDKPGDACNDPQCKNHHESAVEKCGICKSNEHEKNMSAELTQKVDALAETVNTLAKSVETLTKAAPVDLTKVLADIGDLQKRAEAAQSAAATGERTNLISKMAGEGRVAFKEDGTAYTDEELSKLELPILKVLAKNSTVLPLKAQAIYKGGSKPKFDPALKGSQLIEKVWEQDYGDLEAMKARFN